jgi:putative restriction endonuclease
MIGKDILNMKNGQSILKVVFFNLIVCSKDRNSENWGGEEYVINNTPQQGINWIDSTYKTLAVILKSKEGKYAEDKH